MTHEYMHGYSKDEQKRLLYQARLVEDYVYDFIDLKKTKRLLEVGCGVGAQTQILLERFSKMHVTGVDISDVQLATARSVLKNEIKKGKVDLVQSDATNMPFKSKSFDGAFICWFLEHVPDPLTVLKETRRFLEPGSPIFCTEVQNSGVFVDPYSPSVLKYWYEFNDVQWTEKGHPFVGAQLGNLLKEAGYKDIVFDTQTMIFDSRNSAERKKFIRYFHSLMMSAKPMLEKHGRINDELVQEVSMELDRLAMAKNSVVFFPFCRARAKA